jgi:hypothetical protein
LVKESTGPDNWRERSFEIVFHNLGLRSWIECSLCWDCPREDAKGCCYYNPTYYPTDFAYLLANDPEAIKVIFSMPRITILEEYMSVDRLEDKDGDFRCQFHSLEGGCRWAPELRESVCRFYVCPGCSIWEEEGVGIWKEFFDRLEAYEMEVNQALSKELKARGLDMKSNPVEYFKQLEVIFKADWSFEPDWCRAYPREQKFILKRPMRYGKEWKL